MKNYTVAGVIIGVILAFSIIMGNWPLLLLVILLGGAGGVIGAHFDGRIDLRALWNGIIGKSQG